MNQRTLAITAILTLKILHQLILSVYLKDHIESATADQSVRAIWKIIIATKITNPSFMAPRPLSILPNDT